MSKENVLHLCERVKEIRMKCTVDGDKLANFYPWDVHNDLRITAISQLTRLMIGLNVSFIYLCQSDQEKALSEIRSFLDGTVEINQYLVVYEMFLKLGFTSSLYFILERAVKIYLLTLDPAAYEIQKGIAKKCDYLLNHIFNDDIVRFTDNNFTFLRHIRNSLHTNGIHLPDGHKNDEVEVNYRNKKYTFQRGKKLDFITWDLLLDLADDMRALLWFFANNSTSRSFQGVIPDNINL